MRIKCSPEYRMRMTKSFSNVTHSDVLVRKLSQVNRRKKPKARLKTIHRGAEKNINEYCQCNNANGVLKRSKGFGETRAVIHIFSQRGIYRSVMLCCLFYFPLPLRRISFRMLYAVWITGETVSFFATSETVVETPSITLFNNRFF